jgi:tyrosine-protein kinase Etk/Wzc
MSDTDFTGNGATRQKPTLLRHYLELILEQLGFITKFTLIATILAIIILFMMPRTYTAKTVLMPPEDPNKQNALLQAIGNLGLAALSGTSTVNMTEVLVEVLKSYTVAESLMVEQNLEALWLSEKEREKSIAEKREKLRALLSEVTRINANKQGFITIEVRCSTPMFSFQSADDDSARARAARLANAYVSVLDRINRRLANAKSLYNAEYFSAQLKLAKSELDSAYAKLENFQKSNKAVAISEQMKLQLETLSKLKATIITEEINLDLLLRDRQQNDLLVIEAKNRLSEMQRKYNDMLLGKSDNYAMSLEQVPTLAREYANYYREVKISEEVYALLKQLYYKERLQGYRNTPSVIVLDEAREPVRHSSPKRLETTLFVALLAMAVAVGIVFMRNFLQRTREEEGYARLWALWQQQLAKVRYWGTKAKSDKPAAK